MVDVAAREKVAKAKGYESYGARVNYLRWKAVRFVTCVAVVGYVFFDYVVKWV